MRRLVKILIAIAVVIVVVIASFALVRQCTSQLVVGNAVTALTGNEEAGQAAADIMNGVDLSDAELADAFGLDASTFAQVKEAANSMGIDVNDSSQLSGILAANVGKADELKGIYDEVSSGQISPEEAASELEGLIEIPEAN